MSGRSAHAVVLVYHRLDLEGAAPEEGDFALPGTLFERQMDWLVHSGRPIVSLRQVLAGEFDDGAVVLTFDDGCDTDVTVALPRLRDAGFPGAFFVNPARLGRKGQMSWSDIEALSAAGMEVGSHGLDHTLLDDLPPAEVERQLDVSRHLIAEALRREIDALSLPGGTGGRRALEIARRIGYRVVLGSQPGRVLRGRSRLPVPRYAVRRRHGLAGFTALVEQRPGFRTAQSLRYHGLRMLRGAIGTGAYVRWAQRVNRVAGSGKAGVQ